MPTIKQRKAAKEVAVNGGIISKAMVSAGYSKKSALRTDTLTRTKGWQELMDKFIPDTLLAKKHRELLEVPIKVRTYVKGELITEHEELDSNAVKAGLDMGYKLKGRYAPEKVELDLTKVEEMTKKVNDLINAHSRRPKIAGS